MSTTTTLRMTGPADVIRSIPALIGFQPSESLVIVALQRGTVLVTARLDLNDTDNIGPTLDVIDNHGADGVILVGWSNNSDIADAATSLAAGVSESYGIDVKESLRTDGTTYWSMLCDDTACCPPEGKPVEGTITDTQLNKITKGLDSSMTREQLVDSINPVNPMLSTEIDEHLDANPQLMTSAEIIALGQDPRLCVEADNATIARIASALFQIRTRDEVWLAIEEGVDMRCLMLTVARKVPQFMVAAPLFLLGWQEWRSGDGTRAGIAIDRVLQCVPNYNAALMLDASVRAGVNPSNVRRLTADDLGQ